MGDLRVSHRPAAHQTSEGAPSHYMCHCLEQTHRTARCSDTRDEVDRRYLLCEGRRRSQANAPLFYVSEYLTLFARRTSSTYPAIQRIVRKCLSQKTKWCPPQTRHETCKTLPAFEAAGVAASSGHIDKKCSNPLWRS